LITAESEWTTPAIRWGGAALALSAFTFTVTILLYVFAYGQPVGTGVVGEVTFGDKAAHVLARWEFISKIWLVESVACSVMAVTGFVLRDRVPSGAAWLPSRVAWTAVGVGAVIQSLMYAFMLGGYPAAAEGYETSPALFEGLQGAATFLFYLGNLAVYFGLGGVFLAEASPNGLLPRWVALLSAVTCFAVAALLLGLLAGVGKMMYAAPGALIGFMAAIYLGFSIHKRG
jgi:hypothetical protein